jgi:hypothetical protein
MDCRQKAEKQSVNLILTVLEITAPVFGLAAIGFAWDRLGFEYRLQFVTRLAMTLAMPCLIFTALMQADIRPAALSAVSLGAVLSYAALGLVALAGLRLARLDIRTYLAPMISGNTGNLGLPLALFAFGDQGLGYAVVIFAITAIIAFSVGVWLVAGGGSPLKVLREPLVGASLLGVLFLWQGWQTPRVLTNSLELIGQLGIPLMLLTLGVAVARLRPAGLGRAAVISVIRVLICAGVSTAIAVLLQLDPIASAVLIVQISTPVAVTSYLLAEKYGADSEAVAGLVVVSTLISVISLPITLAFVI